MTLKVGYKLPTKSECITGELLYKELTRWEKNKATNIALYIIYINNIAFEYETEDKFKSPAAWVKKLFCGGTLDDLPHSLRHGVCDSGGG